MSNLFLELRFVFPFFLLTWGFIKLAGIELFLRGVDGFSGVSGVSKDVI